MNHRITRTRRDAAFRPEMLEGRELLSTLAPSQKPSAEVHAAAIVAPLKGTLKGTAFITPTMMAAATETVAVSIVGTGDFARLGRSKIITTHTVTIDLTNGDSTVSGGVATIVTPNKNRVFLKYDGTGVPDGTGGFNDTFHFVIVGGTGRFAGASGNATVLAFDKPPTSPVTFPFTGTLNGVIALPSPHR